VFVYAGSAAGLPTLPTVTIDNPANQAGGWFGVMVASADESSRAARGWWSPAPRFFQPPPRAARDFLVARLSRPAD
jgi:hypothetical protein